MAQPARETFEISLQRLVDRLRRRHTSAEGGSAMALVVCRTCRRHVKDVDSVCPFCGATMPTAFRPPLGGGLVLGMGLAVASCESSDANPVTVYGPSPYDVHSTGGVAAYGPPPCHSDFDCPPFTRCGSDSFCFRPSLSVGGNGGSAGSAGAAAGGHAGASGSAGETSCSAVGTEAECSATTGCIKVYSSLTGQTGT